MSAIMEKGGTSAAVLSVPRRSYFSTRDFRPEQRHREWCKVGTPAMGTVFDARPDEGFKAEVDSIRLGTITLLSGTYGAQSIRRSEEEIGQQPLDVVCVAIAGSMSLSGPLYTIRPGSIGLIDFNLPFEHHSTEGSLTSVVIPRDLLVHAGIDVAGLHGKVFSEAHSAMFRNYIVALRMIAENVPGSEEDRVVRSILDLLALTLASAGSGIDLLSGSDLTLKGRAEQLITSQSDIDGLNVDVLCRALGISRTRLYALYRNENGVTARLQRERLERARIAIEVSDLTIGEIAYRLGFHQPAHFSRLFKQMYGKSPRQWRSAPVPDA